MAGVLFSHPTVGKLSLRLAPTSVEWTYNLNTSTTPTYAGEVVQILSVNFDQFIMQGRFGKEGPHGRNLVSKDRYEPRPIGEYRDYTNTGKYAIGLSQMTEYFRDYFAIASQGNDAHAVGHYDQAPMTITYDGSSDIEDGSWVVYPVSFPSYRRSNVDFAPEWQVVCEVEEPDYKIKTHAMTQELSNLRSYVGYFPQNRFSDPFGQYDPFTTPTKEAVKRAITQAQISAVEDSIVDIYQHMMPAYNENDVEMLLNSSGPWVFSKALKDAGVNLG